MEWIDHRTLAGQEAGCIICVVGNILVVPLEVNAFQLVIESGLAEAFLSVVKACESAVPCPCPVRSIFLP